MRDINRLIDVYLAGQDLREDPAFTASVNWCRIKREGNKGRFVKHGKAFRLTALRKPQPRKLIVGRRFDASRLFSADQIIGRLEMFS